MKVKIEFDDSLDEDEIVLICKSENTKVTKLKQMINDLESQKIECYIKDQVHFLNENDILFFETTGNSISAHTITDVYEVKYRLYEIEKMLQKNFIRVSKSAILNINHIKSIDKNLTSVSIVEFFRTHKKVYVSRFYYSNLKQKLKERFK